MIDLALVYSLLVLHGPDGREVLVNPSYVVALRPARQVSTNDKLYPNEARCLVSTVDGKNIAVVEPCEQIREAVREGK